MRYCQLPTTISSKQRQIILSIIGTNNTLHDSSSGTLIHGLFKVHLCLRLFIAETFSQAVSATDAWIVTGGLRDGLVMLIDEAFSQRGRWQHVCGQGTRVVGIVDWHLVRKHNNLVNNAESVGRKGCTKTGTSPCSACTPPVLVMHGVMCIHLCPTTRTFFSSTARMMRTN